MTSGLGAIQDGQRSWKMFTLVSLAAD